MKINVHAFEVNGGNVVTDGKSHWPDCLNIDIPCERVLGIAEQLIRSFRYNQYNDPGQIVQLNFMGKLEYDIDEDADPKPEGSPNHVIKEGEIAR